MTFDITEDFSFDDVQDNPEIRVFPTGAYRCKVTAKEDSKEKDGVTKRFVSVSFTVTEIKECHDEENTPKMGDTSIVRYYMWGGKDGGKFARGEFKKVAGPVGAAIGNANYSAIMAALDKESGGLEADVVMKRETGTYNGAPTENQKIITFNLA